MSISHWIPFFGQYLAKPHEIGAFAPSSRRLAVAVTEPFAARSRPARVLEVGAGTGAITRHLAELMGDQDQLDICELNPEFVRILERDILTLPSLRKAREEGRIQIHCCKAEDIDRPGYYDFVVSGLPLNSFERPQVEKILQVIGRNLKPGGIYSYYEYIGVSFLARYFAWGRTRRRLREVGALLNERIERYQVKRRAVILNVLPANARHWCWDPSSEAAKALRRHAGEFQGVTVPAGARGM